MRVIFITREGCALSGARVRCYNFAREIARYGIDAQVLSFADDLGAPYGENESKMSFFEKLGMNFKAFKLLLKEGSDTVFILQRMNYHVLAPLLVSLLKRNRVVLDCDDWNIRENPVYHFGFYPSSKMEYVTRKVAKHATACVAASDFLQTYLKEFNPRIWQLPTGVNTDLFSPRNRQDASKVVFSWIGTAYHPEMGQNIRFILDCFSSVADQRENVALILAGEGKYFEEIKKDMAGFRHKERVEICSWIHPEKVPEYLANVDVGLLPLIQDTKFNRAKSPTKLFEYMSMAKPVIASKIGEAQKIIRDGETGFLAKNHAEFISKMHLLIENPQLRQSMGSKAREDAVTVYSLKVLGKKLADVLTSL